MEFREGQTATNPKTGQKIVFKGGQWVSAGQANPTQAGVYRDALAKAQATKDVARLEASSAGAQNAFASEATLMRANALLPRTPVGPFAEQRIALGKTLPNVVGNILPGVPNKEETANLEEFRNIASQGALGDVSKLKGPLSEKELAFIQNLQVSPSASRQGNQRVIDAQHWVARRQAAYDAALQRWTTNTGAPSAKNGRGQTFDQWWGQYSAQALPPPGVKTAKPTAAKTAGGYTIISVE